MQQEEKSALRRGWTTGTCATAAAKSAFAALVTGSFPDPVAVTLPGGQRPAFALARMARDGAVAEAAVVKDAGDDPDVTHGALIVARVRLGEPGTGVTFRAGPGVGTVTRPGLPLAPGEPAINPVPRRMIRTALAEVAAETGVAPDAVVEISVPDGERLAERTMNGRLGILGGISILGTTGIVVPYSCAAWIASIHQGIDVARAAGVSHVAGATGATSEAAVARYYGLAELQLIDMGDFVGGMLKHLRAHPIARVTIAGGFAKMTKLGQGLLDLHSKRGEVDLAWLAALAERAGAAPTLVAAIAGTHSANAALLLSAEAGLPIARHVAQAAQATAAAVVEGAGIALDLLVFDRAGALLAHA